MNNAMWVSKDASDIANYVVNYANERDCPITHLKLQKILYYLQGNVAARCDHKRLFADSIEAWQYGPVVRTVYFEYCPNGSLPLKASVKTRLDLPNDVQEVMDSVIDEKMTMTESQLVRATHQERPWEKHRKEALAKQKPEISFKEIDAYFSSLTR